MTRFECRLQSLDAFRSMLGLRPETLSRAQVDEAANIVRLRGTVTLGRLGAVPVMFSGTNYREDIRAFGAPMRAFALLDLVDEATGMNRKADVLCLEGLTPFAQMLKGFYPKAICSEYAPDSVVRARIAPIPHVDAMNMPFADATLDAVLSADVLEHVPDLDRVLSETARVLRTGGAMIATFPFASGNHTSIHRAVLEGGVIRHILEPEYHGDPVRPGEGALVFEIPGWDIINRTLAARFRSAVMVFVADTDRGYIGNDMDGLFTLYAIR
jgi:SAM-dependent methyltransferase